MIPWCCILQTFRSTSWATLSTSSALMSSLSSTNSVSFLANVWQMCQCYNPTQHVKREHTIRAANSSVAFSKRVDVSWIIFLDSSVIFVYQLEFFLKKGERKAFILLSDISYSITDIPMLRAIRNKFILLRLELINFFAIKTVFFCQSIVI